MCFIVTSKRYPKSNKIYSLYNSRLIEMFEFEEVALDTYMDSQNHAHVI